MNHLLICYFLFSIIFFSLSVPCLIPYTECKLNQHNYDLLDLLLHWQPCVTKFRHIHVLCATTLSHKYLWLLWLLLLLAISINNIDWIILVYGGSKKTGFIRNMTWNHQSIWQLQSVTQAVIFTDARGVISSSIACLCISM